MTPQEEAAEKALCIDRQIVSIENEISALKEKKEQLLSAYRQYMEIANVN